MRSTLIEVQLSVARIWRSTHARWMLAISSGLVGLGLAAVACWHLMTLTVRLAATDEQARTAREAMEKRERDGAVLVTTDQRDFVRRLPESVDAQPGLAMFQHGAEQAGATFVGVQIQGRPPARDQLTRANFTVSMRGSYPKLIQVLSETLARYPCLTLTNASLRRESTPQRVDATFVVALWGAPPRPDPIKDEAIAPIGTAPVGSSQRR